MAIVLPGFDQLPSGPRREFFDALHELYDTAGQPGARVISLRIRRNLDLTETVSHETVSAVLRGASVPTWAKVHSIVVALAAQSTRVYDVRDLTERIRQLWLAAKSDPQAPDQGRRSGRPVSPIALTPFSVPPIVPTELTRAPNLDIAWSATNVDSLPASNGQIVGGLPDHNPYFTGRELLLEGMRERLSTNRNALLVLYGLGGAGKTQLAREYIRRHGDGYALIWWVSASSAQQARASLIGLAERLAMPVQRSAEQTVHGTIQRLESGQFTYLLVLDGVEDAEIRQLVPAVGGHVVVTCRDPTWAHDPSSIGMEVPGFDPAEAIQFLRKRGKQLSGQEAERLAQVVGLLPLALEQVTALQLATGQQLDELLTQLSDPTPGLLATGQPTHYPLTVSASLQLALTQLDLANPVALLAFELFAWFGAEPVSIALLRAGRTGEVSPALARTLRDPVHLRKVIADISRFGLARLNADAQRVEVQPVMRLALRDALSPAARERARLNVHAILAAADPGWPDDLATFDMHREMAAHVLPSGLVESKVEAAQRAVYHQVRYRLLYGDYRDACELAEAAVTRWRLPDFLGPGHALVLDAGREWANALRAMGQYRRARELTSDGMRQLQADARYGDEHPLTIAMAAGCAADLRIGGEYREALNIATENYRRHIAHYGGTHWRTMLSHHNLAVSLRLIGDFAGAQDIDQALLAHNRETLGMEHRRTLLSANALAEDLYGLGEYAKALEVLSVYLAVQPRTRGVADVAVLLAGRTAALAGRALGEQAEALESLRTNYHDGVTSLGSDHEYTLAATMSYANTLRQAGQSEEAYVHATDAVGAYRRTFGVGNPLTLAAEVNLAAILRVRGERVRARQADRVTSDALRAAVGDRHPFSIAAMINLATDHSLAGDHSSARRLSEVVFDLATQARGESHPVTLAAAANLAIDRAATGESEAADGLLQNALAGLRRRMGPLHRMVTQAASGVRIECEIEPPST